MKLTAKLALVLLVLISISLLALGHAADAKKGKDLYAAKCLTCHGAKGEVKPAIATMFKITMLPLGSKEIQSKSDEELVKGLIEGKGKMVALKMTKSEAADVIAFVKTLK